jgi:hypothetical protein
VAQEVVARLNMLWHETHSEKASSAELGTYAEIAIAVPMDGFAGSLMLWRLLNSICHAQLLIFEGLDYD